jgi:hypothetical protein
MKAEAKKRHNHRADIRFEMFAGTAEFAHDDFSPQSFKWNLLKKLQHVWLARRDGTNSRTRA